MGSNRHGRGGIAAAAGAALFALTCDLRPGFAARWRDGVARPALRALNRLTGRVPFPVLEPLALVAAALALAGLLRALAKGFARRSAAPLGHWLRGMLRAGLCLGGALALLWLPICRTSPAVDAAAPDAAALEGLCAELTKALNAAALRFPAPEALLQNVAGAAGMADCAVKAARYPEWLRADRLAGLFFPPTGEAVVDATAPEALLPFTAVHELMHLAGIADEGAANVASYERCLDAGGALADSARLWALRYATGLLREADEAALRRARARMSAPLAEAFRACGGPLAPPRRGSYAALAAWLCDPKK